MTLDDDWTPEDDERVRSALLSLRTDVLAAQLPEPAVIRNRYASRSRRRRIAWSMAAAVAAVAAAGIAFAQLGNPWASDQLSPGENGPSITEPVPEADSGAAGSPTGDATDEPTGGQPSTGATVPPCNAVVGEVNTDIDGITAEQVATAERLMALALACDRGALANLATADETTLSFGAVVPEDVFVIPPNDDDRYGLLTRLLMVPPQLDPDSDIVRWPVEPETDADWQALVDAGILSQDDMELIREDPSGYVGYRVGIAADGTWNYFVGGD